MRLSHWLTRIGEWRPNSDRRRGSSSHVARRQSIARIQLLERRDLLVATWMPQGPSTSQDGQVEGIADGEVIGAIHAIVTHPTDASIAYVGSVNGGVWRTTSATSADPDWSPLFDRQSSLSIGALAMDPTDPQRLAAGIGRYSGFAQNGGRLTGIALTSDGGESWTEINDPLLQGESVSGIALIGDVVLVATNPFFGGGGIFRRADATSGFTTISGTGGLPAGGAYDLVSDPSDPDRFYVSVASGGLYRSDDAGVNWVSVSEDDTALNSAITDAGNNNTEMAVASNGRVYVAVIITGQVNYIGYSDDHGDTWTAMDLPQTTESNSDIEGLHPGAHGGTHFSIAVDPTDPNTVYVGGDRQDSPFPNAIGANDFTGRLFRGDTTIAPTGAVPSPQWEHLTHSNNIAETPGGGTGNGSAPHAGSRDISFDANGNLIEVNDGGIYRRTGPRTNSGDWYSMIGDLQIAEIHNIAYDNNSNVLISGNQDTGTTYQLETGESLWKTISQGTGGDVAVDNVTLAGAKQSIRYTSSQGLAEFKRSIWDDDNNLVSSASPALTVTGGGAPLVGQYITPVVLSEVAPTRLVIGAGNSVYESLNQGNTITELGAGITADAIAYGGHRLNTANPDVLYVAQDATIYVRTTAGGALSAVSALPPGADTVSDIELDPNDWMRAWVVDGDQVFQTVNAGVSWTDITGNLVNESLRSIEYISGPVLDGLVVGGLGGVYKATDNNFADWSSFGVDLPNVPVWDLDYDSTDDVLAAGTLGRGAWTLANTGQSLIEPDRFETAPLGPNNTRQTASPVGVGLGVHVSNVSLHLPTDQDWYQFEVLRTDSLDISAVYGETDGVLNLQVFDESGNQLGTGTYNNGRNTASLSSLLPGSYYVRVAETDNSTTSYQLEITPGAGSTTRVFYVNDSSVADGYYTLATGDDANDGLTAHTPKASIQDVLDDYEVGPNDLIAIDTGSYSSGVTITASDEGAAFAGTPAGSTYLAGVGFELADADNNLIYGLTFTGHGTGIYLHEVGGVSASTDNIIRENTFHGRSTGINQGAGDISIIDNVFENTHTGVFLSGAAGAVVSGNTIVALTPNSISHGVSVSSSDNVTISENSISGASVGISASNTKLHLADNELFENDQGASIAYGSVTLHGNHIHNNETGVESYYSNLVVGGTDWTAATVNEIDHNTTGIHVIGSGTVQYNRLHRNATAVSTTQGSQAAPILVDHNVIYRNSDDGVLAHADNGTLITSNTIYAPVGDGVRIQGSSQNIELRNNIIWAENGYALSVATDSQRGFASDYNNLFATRDATHNGRIVSFQKDFIDLFDWQVESNYDTHSIGYTAIDPTLDNPQFVDVANDNYQLQDLVSTSIDAGDPSITVDFHLEPSPNGHRLDLGAYGNTTLASQSRATSIDVDYPNFFTDWPAAEGRGVFFRSVNVSGNVDIDLLDAAGNFVADIAVVPAEDGAVGWSPQQSGISGSVSNRYRVRVRSVDNPAITDISREVFSVPPTGGDYFVDDGENSGDQYTTTAVGNNRNTGRTANDPKANLVALLRSYDLGPGDTVKIDAGNYINVRNVVLSGNIDIGDDEGAVFTGPTSAAAGVAVLDRANSFAGSTNIELNDADFVTLQYLTLRGAENGLWVKNGSTHFTGSHLIVSHNTTDGIRIESDSELTEVDTLTASHNGGTGVGIYTAINELRDSKAFNNLHGIVVTAGPQDGTLRLTRLDVHDNSQVGVNISAPRIELTDSSVHGNSTGIYAYSASGVPSIIGSVDSTGAASLAPNEPGASSGRTGNRVYDNLDVGVYAYGNILVFGNNIFGQGEENRSGIGVQLYSGATAQNNAIHDNTYGIWMLTAPFYSNDTARENLVFNNSIAGIITDSEDIVVGNTIYSNAIGIQSGGSPHIEHNIIYGNETDGVKLVDASGSDSNPALLLNNTIYQPTGNAVTVTGGSDHVTLRNNILWAKSGYDISVSNDSQTAFLSDYNVLRVTDTGKVAFWQGLARPTITDWRLTTFTDQHSLADDPLFVDLDGSDNVLGYGSVTQNGSDDDFHVKSTVGRFTGSLAPVITHATASLPTASPATPVALPDSQQSATIDRGAPNDEFDLEPATNGGFINIGAYGNTPHASLSPAEYVLLTRPDGGEVWPAEQTFTIDWRSQIVGGYGTDAGYRDDVLSDEPQGYWRLNDAVGSTVAEDSSTAGQDGTYNGSIELDQLAVWPTSAAAEFDSSDDVVTIADAEGQRGESLSLEAWIYPTATFATYDTVLMKTTNGSWSDGYGLYLSSNDASGTLRFFINNYSAHAATAAVPLNQWSHVVATYDESSIKLYVDGTLAGETPYSEPINHSSNTLRIGSGEGGYNWRGRLSDVAIYDSVIPDDRIASHANHRPESSGAVDLALYAEGSETPTAVIADDVPNDGTFRWTVPASIPPASNYRVRITHSTNAALVDQSNNVFRITEPIHTYYVNVPEDSNLTDNEYTSASGSNSNTGFFPESPMASVQAVLDRYDLRAGDVILVDTGRYSLTVNVKIEHEDSGVEIRGPVQAGHDAVLDRENQFAGSHVVELVNADKITLSHLTLIGGQDGVHAADGSDSDQILISNSEIFGNARNGIQIGSGNDSISIAHNLIRGNGSRGVQFNGNGSITNNTIYLHPTHGIDAATTGGTAAIIISNNRVNSNGDIGIIIDTNGGGKITASHNDVFENSTGIQATWAGSYVIENSVHDNSNNGIRVNAQATATGNDVFRNSAGISSGFYFDSGEVIKGNRVFANRQAGIYSTGADIVSDNQVYANLLGIQAVHEWSRFTGQLTNNLVYDNIEGGIQVWYAASGAVVRNNTVRQTSGDALRIGNSTSGLEVSNNILSTSGGYALSVAANSQAGLFSDYNIFQFPTATSDGGLGQWQGHDFDSLNDWFFALGYDQHSYVSNPGFVQLGGADAALGYSGLASGAATIVDDGDAGFAVTGDWESQTSIGRGDGELERVFTDGHLADGVATWTFTGLTPGASYEIAATWERDPGRYRHDYSTARFEISNGGLFVSRRDAVQYSNPDEYPEGEFFSADGSDWRPLGTIVATDGTLTVQLSAASAGRIIADSIRLQQIVGDRGFDDRPGFALQTGSVGVDQGDPLTIFSSEPAPNGNRVNIGADGNTSRATNSSSTQMQVLSPEALGKVGIGDTVTIDFQSSGLTVNDPVLLLNAGGGAFENWTASQFATRSQSSTITESIDLSGLVNPAPQSIYQSYAYTDNYNPGARMSFALPVPDGTYTVRLHFVNAYGAQPVSSGTSQSQVLDVHAEGNLVLDQYDLPAETGSQFRADIETFSVAVSGQDGLSLDFINEGYYPTSLAAIEVLRAAPTGTVDPRATIEVSRDNGGTWAAVGSDVALDRFGRGSFNWTIPQGFETQSTTALVRVTSGGTSGVSIRPFLIAPQGNDYYVNDNSLVGDVFTTAVGNDLNSGKTPDRPVASLYGLLASYDLGPGDVIHVDAGTYQLLRSLQIDQSDEGVRIEGPSSDSAVLNRGIRSGYSVIDVVNADDVTLSHLTLTGASFGVHATGSARLTIADSQIYDNDNTGISIDSSNTATTLRANTVFRNSIGINQGSSGLIENNRVFSNGATGITASSSADSSGNPVLVVRNNTVSDNSGGINASSNYANGVAVINNRVFANVATGVSVAAGASATGNIVYDNQTGIASGFSFDSSETITNNRVFHNRGTGIYGTGGDLISGNQIYANSVGIQAVSEWSNFHSAPQILNNLIYDSSSNGILLQTGNSASAAIRNNTIHQPIGDAVRVAAGVYAAVENNILLTQDGYAISVAASSQPGFYSDYNIFQTPVGTADGGLGEWQSRDYDSLNDWRFQVGYDQHSQVVDPRFNDPDGADNISSYSTTPISPAVIIDDGATGFSTTGSWVTDVIGRGVGGTELQSTANSVSASWTFSGLQEGGTYELAVTWHESGPYDPASADAEYAVFDGTTRIITTTRNQSYQGPNDFTADGAHWSRIVTFIASASTATLQLTPITGHVAADAARLQRISGDHGADDRVGWRIQSDSPAIDQGDPGSVYSAEPQPNGNRVNIGHEGNTANAGTSPSTQIQVLSPNGVEKLETGSVVPIEWQISGIGQLDPVLQLNAGGPAIGRFAADQFLRSGHTTTGGTSSLIGLLNPAPQEVYQTYTYGSSGPGSQFSYQLPVPDGTYTVRLHFVNEYGAAPAATAGNFAQVFDVFADGALIIDDYDLPSETEAQYRAAIANASVTVTGGDGLSLAFLNQSYYSATIAAIELLRANPAGQSDPRATVELSRDNGSTWTTLATNVAHDPNGRGEYLWTIPANFETAGSTALVRVAVNPTDVSDRPFLIANNGRDFYINDGQTTGDVFTTAVGSDLNSGKSADRPMATLAALLEAYDLEPGDVIHVDTGNYITVQNILIGAEDAGVRIEGPSGTTPRAIFDRDLTSQSFANTFDIHDAAGVTLDSLGITGGYHGVLVTGASNQFNLRRSEIYGNAHDGVALSQNGHEYLVADNVMRNNGASGLSIRSDGVASGNRLFGNASHGIYAINDTLDNTLEVRDNLLIGQGGTAIHAQNNIQAINNTLVSSGGGTGIYATSGATVAGNTVSRYAVGISTSSGNSFGGSTEYVYNNRAFANSSTGISADWDDIVSGNTSYSNSIGIHLDYFHGEASNNIVYANTNYGIEQTSRPFYQTGASELVNNSVFQDVGDAIRLTNSSNVRVANNILWVNAGHALFVDSPSQPNFRSDRNVIARGPNPIVPGDLARAGFWGGETRPTLADWQQASGQDIHSVEADPRWLDINGPDNLLGYTTAGGGFDGGRDDNFSLRRNSVAIDRADTHLAPFTDHVGAARHNDQGTPDVGTPGYAITALSSSGFTETGVAQGFRNYGAFYDLTLPFAFPFYDDTFTHVSVSTSGFLQFGGANGAGDVSNSTSELLLNARIAPLWDNIFTYNEGDDVFVDTSVANQVTIRWNGTLSENPGDLNFSVTLFDTGRIQFHYGAGNAGLTPTVGISRGDGRHYLLASYDGASSLAHANSVEIAATVLGFADIGALEFLGDSNDEGAPRVLSSTPTALHAGGNVSQSRTQLLLNMSEPLNVVDANAPSNFLLRSRGQDGAFDTEDDVLFEITPSYIANTTVLTLSTGMTLPLGRYRLTVLGNAGLNDASGNKLDGDGDGHEGGDYVREFDVVTNISPTAAPDTYSLDEDTTLSVLATTGVLANDADANGDPITAVLISGPSHGTLTLNANGSFNYVPAANYHGTDSFTYQATDGLGFSPTRSVTLTVNSILDTPVAGANSYSIAEDNTLVVAGPGVLGNDSDGDGDTLTAVLVSGTSHGSLTLNSNGSFTYEPVDDFFGQDEFRYQATDGSLSSGVITVTLNVTSVNDAPVGTADSFSLLADTALSIEAPGVLENDTDTELATLSVMVVTGTSHGTLTLNPDGSFDYVPATGYVGPDSFVYRAFDGLDHSNDTTVSITVRPLNTPPVATGEEFTLYENTTLQIAAPGLLTNDIDDDGDSLSVLPLDSPAHGSLTLNGDGSFSYTPNSGYRGPDSFTYLVSDATDSSNTVTVILNIIQPPTLSIAATNAGQHEGHSGNTPFTFTVARDGDTTVAATVNYAISGSGANQADAADFGGTLPSGTVTFAAGETSKIITIHVTGDTVVESDEGFTVTLSSPSTDAILGTATATGSILNDDASLAIAATSASKSEGHSGNTAFTFTVTRTGNTSGTTTANFAITGSGANPANVADFGGTFPSGTVTFAAGETSKVITINVTGDTAVESDEGFTITLSIPSAGAILGTSTATGSILNDDASLAIAATSASKSEGHSGSTAFTFTVTRTGDITGTATANYAVTGSGANAANAADFGGTLPSGTVTFAGGETSKVITINVTGDTAVESDEGFTITLSDPSAGAILGTSTATGSILNDDASLAIAATSASKSEGHSGNTAFTFTVTRTGNTSGTTTANFVITGSGANLASVADFGGTFPSGTVTFAAGETSKVITIDVTGDTAVESDEGFTITLSDPSAGAILGTSTATGSILNDDASLAIAATSASKSEGHSGSTAFTFTVTRTGDTTGTATANYAVTGSGTNAANAADFGATLPSGAVTFAAGETSKVITINVTGDTVVESDEGFTITLSNPSAGAILGTSTATGSILNDDASLAIAATSASKSEGHSGNTAFTFTVTRTGNTSGTTTANFVITGSGANPANVADFGGTFPGGTVTFAAGETSKVITINVTGDTVVESDEGFTITLSNPSAGAILSTSTATGSILNDDASLAIAATSASKSEGLIGNTAFTFTVTRTGDITGTATANYAVTGSGTNAANAADFGATLPSGAVTFAAGETGKVITVNVTGDTIVELDEGFTITLSNPSTGAVLGTSTATGSILNDDASLAIAATSASKSEGLIGNTAFTFTVTRSGNTTGAATATFLVTGSGTNAGNAADFGGILPSGTVTFAAGETSKVVTINVTGDATAESDEGFTVTLSGPSAGVVLGTPTATGTILNDDVAGFTLTATDASTTVSESGSTDSISVVLTAQPASNVVLSVTSSDTGEATVAPATLTFNPSNWNIPQTVTVTGVNDDQIDGAQNSTITVSVVDASSDNAFDPLADKTVTVSTTDIGIASPDVTIKLTGNQSLVVQSANGKLQVLINNVADTSYSNISTATVRSISVDGGTGDNLIDLRNVTSTAFSRTGGVTVSVQGAAGKDTIFGSGFSDALSGGDGDDSLDGGAGDDSLDGGLNNDTLTGGFGTDSLDGGDGTTDVLTEFSAANLTLTAFDLTRSGDADDTDEFLGIERAMLLGGGAANVFDASEATIPVTLFGGGGNDLLVSGSQSDFIDGQAGDDTITGGNGNDSLAGGTGNDAFRDIAYTDVVTGQTRTITLTNTLLSVKQGTTTLASDSLSGFEVADLTGGAMRDIINAAAFTNTGVVTISGGGGNDVITGTEGADMVFTLSGADSIVGGGGGDTIFAGNGNDTIIGGNGADNLNGQNGNDTIAGDADNDVLIGGAGIDTMTGGTGNDFLSGQTEAGLLIGGEGNDTLNGNTASDTLQGNAGDDRLFGLQGNDVLDAGDGADSLVGAAGNDSLSGGGGADTLQGDIGDDQIDGGADFDRINEIFDTNVTIVGIKVSTVGLGIDTVSAVERIQISGGVANNFFDARQATVPVFLSGAAGNDTLLGGTKADGLTGGDGDDVMSGGAGGDILDGGAGTDYVFEKADTNFTINGLTITSTVTGTDTPTNVERIVLIGGAAANKLDASAATISVVLLGGKGNDTLLGGSTADTLSGGNRGDSTVAGSDGVDSLNGGAGADVLENDTADTKVLGAGDTQVADVFTQLPSWIDTL